MTLKNPTRCVRALMLFGLVLTVACESDVTSLGRKSKPEFVLLTPGTVSQVSAGGYHSCALRTDGAVACWGLNRYGQATAPAGVFTQVSAGGSHTCALKSDGTVACWGDNSSGQATPPAGAFTGVSAGGVHTCGLTTRSEEHTSELQSPFLISYAVFCLKKKMTSPMGQLIQRRIVCTRSCNDRR